MGLDMYLTRKVYVGANYEHRNVKGNINITVGEDNKPLPITFNKIKYIEEEGAYWRKANQIHKWFVNNCQNGEDDCKDSYVSIEQLKELVDTCKKVLTDHSLAEELLPTEEGFFFGSTDYDEYYYKDLEETIEMLEPLLQDNVGEYYYCSSW